MYIEMDKIKEDQAHVHYTFYMTAGLEQKYNPATNKNEDVKIIKYGICTFNKVSGDFSIDENQTDAYFADKSREKAKILWKLIQYQKAGYFPDIIDIASG